MKAGSCRFSQLSSARQALIRLCQEVNFGEVQKIRVLDGEPVFDPPPILMIDVKLNKTDEPRPELELADFDLHDEVCRLMNRLDRIKEGTATSLQVIAGIPTRMVFEAKATQIAIYKGRIVEYS